MFSLETARDLIANNAWLASVDLRDAYYTIPITVAHRKYLRFLWDRQLFKFNCLPNGLACTPRLFTAILKPIFRHMSVLGHTMFPYIDDSFIIADSKFSCASAVTDLCALLTKMGFFIYAEKSVLTPTNKL